MTGTKDLIDTALEAMSTDDIVKDSIEIVRTTQDAAHRYVNTALIARNWLLGRRIVEEELIGGNKANYGKNVIGNLSSELTKEFGKGYSERSLRSFANFYRMFPEILQTLSAKSSLLSWSHYQELMNVPNDKARAWYHEHARSEGWSVRELRRNISSQHYQRLIHTQGSDKTVDTCKTTSEHDAKTKRLEFIRNPIVAEFLGLPQDRNFTESDLETAILNNLQRFMLELGKGFAFVARQKHMRTDCGDFFVDLVFYNIDLRCYVLIDLKTGELTHQDIGQMDMYVRMFDEMERRPTDEQTIGIILCTKANRDLLHYSVLNDSDRLFASKYLTYMPDEESLRAEIEAQKAIYYAEHPEEKED